VISFDAGTVTVLDASTGRTLGGPIPVRGHPQGHQVYVVDDTGMLSVLNTATNRIDSVAVGSYPYGVMVGPGGVDVYLTTLRPNSLVVLDTTTDKLVG
jgi:YVTN family beta-propeller protein